MTPDHVQHDPAVAASLDRVRRQWGSAVEEGAPESASIKSSAFAPAETTNAGAPPAPVSAPRRSVATGDGDAGPEDFVLGELLGKGGMGLVFRAEQAGLDRDVALKTILPGHAADGTARRKFFAEAQVTGQLDHPNIVPIYELAAAPDGALFYTMKEVRGRPWSKAMPTLSEAENVDILLKVADAVAFAHGKGVIHRDLKPENVMLGDYGEVLLMDWGLAVGVADGAKAERLTSNNARGGTPAYMAPEMAAADAGKIGPASDVYLLGAILYEILTGLRPHHAENVFACIAAALQNTVQPSERRDEMSAVARRALATAPAERFRDVRAFQRAVRDCREHAASLALSKEARAMLKRAMTTGDYGDYARTAFGFEEALRLWPGNGAADTGLTIARKHYAEAALERGDFDLALSQTKMMSAADAGDLPRQAEAGKVERKRRRIRVRRLTQLSIGLGGLVLVVWIVAYWRVSQSERKAVESRQMAVAEQQMAIAAQQMAVAAQQEAESALAAKERAEVNEKHARAKQTELSDELASAAERLGLLEKTESARTALLGITDGQGESAGSSVLATTISNISVMRAPPGADALPKKAKALTSLSLMARQPDDFVALIEAFERIERDAARSGLQELRDNVHALTGLIRKRLPQDHDYFPERAIAAMAPATPTEPQRDEMAEDAKTRDDLRAAIKKANPSYRGEGRFLFEDGVVVEVDLSYNSPLGRWNDFDLSPLQGLPLRRLNVNYLNIVSLNPLRGMPLEELRCNGPSDWHRDANDPKRRNLSLAPLAGMPLEELSVMAQGVTTLEPLRGLPLRVLHIDGNLISSFDPLKGTPLEELSCGILLSSPHQRYWTSTLIETQVESVRFVSDLAPLAGMPLRKFTALRHRFKSLDPLRGAPLEYVSVEQGELTSIEGLRGAPLRYLSIKGNRVSSLEPLEGAPLESLDFRNNNISDLRPIRKLPLTVLDIDGNPVKTIAPLKDMVELTRLHVGSKVPVESFSPLKDMPQLTRLHILAKNFSLDDINGLSLQELSFDSPRIKSLRPLADMRTLRVLHTSSSPIDRLDDLKDLSLHKLSFDSPKVKTLKPINNMRTLRDLNVFSSPIDSLQPLRELSLNVFGISRDNARLADKEDMNVLREKEGLVSFDIAYLRGLGKGGGRLSADMFWKQYDAGEFNAGRR